MIAIQSYRTHSGHLFNIYMKSSEIISWRSHKVWPEVKPSDVIMPSKLEDRQLPEIPHTPPHFPPGTPAPIKEPRGDQQMMGPERIHNQLIYKQFGLIALGGGAMRGAHFDMIRDRVNKYLDFERFFAIWRADPPSKAVSKKSLGKKMGGGKAKVHHYETPIRAGRIIFEIAGIGTYGECERIIKNVSDKMPFYTIPITQERINQIFEEKRQIDAKNYNPFEYRDLVRRNFSNSQTMVPPSDLKWGGTYF